MVQIQGFLDDGHENINRDGDPDLSFDGIFGGAIKGLDPEMLFDPFEKQLDLPAATIEVGDVMAAERSCWSETPAFCVLGRGSECVVVIPGNLCRLCPSVRQSDRSARRWICRRAESRGVLERSLLLAG